MRVDRLDDVDEVEPPPIEQRDDWLARSELRSFNFAAKRCTFTRNDQTLRRQKSLQLDADSRRFMERQRRRHRQPWRWSRRNLYDRPIHPLSNHFRHPT